jgi:hypothetical protein
MRDQMAQANLADRLKGYTQRANLRASKSGFVDSGGSLKGPNSRALPNPSDSIDSTGTLKRADSQSSSSGPFRTVTKMTKCCIQDREDDWVLYTRQSRRPTSE